MYKGINTASLMSNAYRDISYINATNLKALRTSKNLKQREVAAMINLSVPGYKRWESKKCFDTEDINRLAKAFNIEPVEMFIELNKGLI